MDSNNKVKEIEEKNIIEKTPSKNGWGGIILISMLTIGILLGLFFISLGLNNLYKSNKVSKDYMLIEAVLTTYELHYDIDEGYVFSPIYTYVINNKEYTIKSKLFESEPPKIGSVIKVKYNPMNFEEAIILNDSSIPYLLFFGMFFVSIPSFIILSFILDHRKKLLIYC